MVNTTLITHVLAVITTTDLFLFQIAMLVVNAHERLIREHGRIVMSRSKTYIRSTTKREAQLTARYPKI